MKLNNRELMQITGGAITATFINAISRAVNTIVKLGQIIGSALRRTISGSYCV